MSGGPRSRPLTRRGFVAFLGTGAAALLSPAVRPARAAAAIAGEGDLAILNFALVLERLQAGLYTEAERHGAVGPVGTRVAGEIGGVERAHVALLIEALGSRAVAGPEIRFGDATTDEASFIRTAVALEDLASAAYLSQLPLITSGELRGLLAAMRTVDAGHAAWIRILAGVTPMRDAFDEPVGQDQAAELLLQSGLVSPRPGDADEQGGVWAAPVPAGPGLLAAFPLDERALTTAPVAAPPAAETESASIGPEVPAALVALSVLGAGGLWLRARRAAARRGTVVGPEEGPVVFTTTATPGPAAASGLAGDPDDAQTEPMSGTRARTRA